MLLMVFDWIGKGAGLSSSPQYRSSRPFSRYSWNIHLMLRNLELENGTVYANLAIMVPLSGRCWT